MGFDMFSQLQGPNIDISLFGDAAKAGAAVGNAIPTDTTAAIEGAIKGVNTGLDLQAKYQDNQVRGHQIERFPTTDAQQDAALKHTQLANQQDELNVALDQQTQDLRLEDRNAALKNNISKTTDELNTRKKEDDFVNEFSALQTNPAQQAQLVLSGKYGDVFTKNPNLYRQSLATVYPALDPEQRTGVDKFFARTSATNYYDREAARREKSWNDAKTLMIEDPLSSQLSKKLDVPPEEYPNAGNFFPRERYQIDPITNKVLLDPKTGQWQINDKFDPKIGGTFSDYIAPDGTVLAENVTQSSRHAYDGYHKENQYHSGAYSRMAADQAVAKIDERNAPPKVTPVSQGTRSLTGVAPGTKQEDPFVRTVKSTLNMSDAQIAKVAGPLESLERVVANYVKIPELRANAGTLIDISNRIDTVVRTISDDEFDNSEALQTQYTPSRVRDYNMGVWQEIASRTGVRSLFESADEKAQRTALFNAYRVDTPRDLYYHDRSRALGPQVTALKNKVIESVATKEKGVFNGEVSAQKNVNYLNQVASGG